MRLCTTYATVAVALSVTGCVHTELHTPAPPKAVKVLVVVAAEWGDTPAEWQGEGRPWAERLVLSQRIGVPGLDHPLFCTNDGACVMIGGIRPTDMAASMMAVGLTEAVDLTRAYILVSGTAGVNPNVGTIGSVAWIRAVVDADLCAEIDPRELPEEFSFSRFSMACDEPWCDPFPEPPGLLRIDPVLLERARDMTAHVDLADDELAQEQRSQYTGFPAALGPPQILTCDAIAGATYWNGAIMSRWASWWVDQWLEGDGHYCMTDAEDFAVLLTAERLSQQRRLDASRLLILRAAADFDQPPEHGAALDSLNAPTSTTLANDNACRVGWVIVSAILNDWAEWREGVPPAS